MIGTIRVGDIIAFSFLYSNMITPLRDVYHILDDSYESGLQMQDLMVTLGEVLDPSFRLDPHDEPTISPRVRRRCNLFVAVRDVPRTDAQPKRAGSSSPTG